jgi:hypothetical protein
MVAMVPTKTLTRSVAWVAAGRQDVVVRGLGTPVSISARRRELTGIRGVIVLSKAVNAAGGKDARKVETWRTEHRDTLPEPSSRKG